MYPCRTIKELVQFPNGSYSFPLFPYPTDKVQLFLAGRVLLAETRRGTKFQRNAPRVHNFTPIRPRDLATIKLPSSTYTHVLIVAIVYRSILLVNRTATQSNNTRTGLLLFGGINNSRWTRLITFPSLLTHSTSPPHLKSLTLRVSSLNLCLTQLP